ncbi:MAG TPA: hypothetical protein VMZ52_10865 [Bryobacteraceae bacterium]|nr:hypothetical protein [Bryobacteraceae bacterium]
MESIIQAVVNVSMRWVHVFSAITLLGGMVYARFAAAPAARSLSVDQRSELADRAAVAFRPWVIVSILALLLSGSYTLVMKSNIAPHYPLWFGLKLLLALHVIAVSYLLTRTSIVETKRNRMMLGTVVSGGLVVLLSAHLRYISNWMTP